jgi:hypothetical protein
MLAAPTVSERVSLKTELDSLINKVLKDALADGDTGKNEFVKTAYHNLKASLKREAGEEPDDYEVDLAKNIMLVLTGHRALYHPHIYIPAPDNVENIFEPWLKILMDCTYSKPYRIFLAALNKLLPSSYTMMIEGLQALKTPALQVLNSAVKAKKCAIEAFHPKVQAEMEEALAASGSHHATIATAFTPSLATVPEAASETPSASDKASASGPPR